MPESSFIIGDLIKNMVFMKRKVNKKNKKNKNPLDISFSLCRVKGSHNK